MYNTDPQTGISFGFVLGHYFPGLTTRLFEQGTNLSFACWEEEVRETAEMWFEDVVQEGEISAFLDSFDYLDTSLEEDLRALVRDDEFATADELADWAVEHIGYEPDEEEFELVDEHSRIVASWLGGAVHLCFQRSPYFACFRECSPCVPGAADLSSPDPGGFDGYCPAPEIYEQLLADGTIEVDHVPQTIYSSETKEPIWTNPTTSPS